MHSQAPRSLGFAATCALLVTTAGAPAWAERIVPVEPGEPATVVCTHAGATVNCSASWVSGGGIPLIVKVVPPADERERASRAERVRAWESYCQPILRYDRYGVGRYVYRVDGCEYGRRQD